jgi:hypothetical protein
MSEYLKNSYIIQERNDILDIYSKKFEEQKDIKKRVSIIIDNYYNKNLSNIIIKYIPEYKTFDEYLKNEYTEVDTQIIDLIIE